MIDEWYSSIREADLADWVTVAAYLFAALLSVRAAERARRSRQARDALFWRTTAFLLVMLGINELLDLQTLLTSLGRAHAKANGWYGEHRKVQYAFVLALGVATLLAATAMLWFFRRMPLSVRMAVCGLCFIALFVLLRAASFHHLDEFFGGGAPDFSWRSLQEVAGILIVIAASASYTGVRSSRR
ncbi:hypothetical protein G7A66_08300 [Altererythrobacter sp. SALINAS58]|uniref:hypothetical protein n=1 Tax=Alteripontixanthobacter muriae TaxID=2705546 RepID=UPI001575D1B4|nr:hypothetical protein [Alteripontixanthobacter muriae]NTZ43090.1 hypothetical protein [Alteripontixanthobacter muriae]